VTAGGHSAAGSGRRPRRWWRYLAVAALLAWPVGRALEVVSWRRAARLPGAPSDGLPRLVVGMHVHTDVADGRGSYDDVVQAARAAGLDAVIVTDHDRWDHASRAGWHDGLLVIVGAELSTDDGHVLAIGAPPPPYPPSYETAAAIADVRRAGGLAIAAHPGRAGELGWAAPIDGLDGVEIANLDAAWRVRVRPVWLAAAVIAAPFAATRSIVSTGLPEASALALHRELEADRPALAIGGADAHGWPFGYAASLAALSNVVVLERPLTGDGPEDSARLLAAIAARRLFVVRPAIADPRGVSFVGHRGEETLLPGDVAPSGRLELVVRSGLDRPVRLRLLRGADVVARGVGHELRATVEEDGPYHAELEIEGPFRVPWVVSNAIRIGSGPSVRPPIAAQPLDSMRESLLEHLSLEHDDRSTMSSTIEHGLLRARLQLADHVHGDRWCALVDRRARDLAPFDAILIIGSADRPIRLDVALTIGGARFRRSIRLHELESTHRLALDSFRRHDGARVWSTDLSAVQNLILTIDHGNAHPGATAQIRLRAVDLVRASRAGAAATSKTPAQQTASAASERPASIVDP